MSTEITIKKGLDINLKGTAEKVLTKASQAATYALCPDHYIGVTPKLLVKVDDKVKAGTPLFFDKQHPQVLFTSPVSGTVSEIVRGDKRKILAVIITPDNEIVREQFPVETIAQMDAPKIKELLLSAGLWPMITQRPFGIIANPDDSPRDIYISALDTAPLGVDIDFILQDQQTPFALGIEVLQKLTCGKVNLSVSEHATAGTLSKIKNAQIHTFSGKHPAGLVGTQIAATRPIAKGEIVWTIEPQHVVMIGRLFATGQVDFEKIIALAGTQFKKTGYQRVIAGAKINSMIPAGTLADNSRLINGNPLCGQTTSTDQYLSPYGNALCAIPEGNKYEFIGWAMPRFHKFSASHSYFSFLTPKKKYNLDTNLNGGERALVMNGIYEKVMPLDIYPVYLLKAILAADIDKMENLGIYEVIEEDLALCEFICPCKIEWQKTLREGINLMIKEL